MATIQEFQTKRPTVRKASSRDSATVAGTLANALADDPFPRWLLGRARNPEQRLLPSFRVVAEDNLRERHHGVFVADDCDSVAIWKGIDEWKLSIAELARHLPLHIRSFRWRTVAMLRALSAAEKVHPTEPHYYLAFLGTRTDRQGKGLGSAVLAPMLERCDREGIPAYVETANPRNQPFYARHGFVELGEVPGVPKGCPPIVRMWREPR